MERVFSKKKKKLNEVQFFYLNLTPLNFAVEQNMIDIVKLLLSNKNIDVNYTNKISNLFFFE